MRIVHIIGPAAKKPTASQPPPTGTVNLVDDDGANLVDDDGANLVADE